jgi:hypothetical protein
MHHLQLIAGISFDPGIRGILVVLTAFVVLPGSRLGLLVAFTALFGWLTILTSLWWLTPPAIGPRGNLPSWKPVEIYVNGSGEVPKTDAVGKLIDPNALPAANKILADNPDLAKEFPNGFTLSELKTNNPALVNQYLDKKSLQGWSLVSSGNAGEAQTAASVALTDAKVYATATDFVKLDVWEYGGKPKRSDECADSDTLCRAWYRVSTAFQITNPPHYAVVQVQQVIPQEAVPGQAPPIPKADTSKPIVSVVLVRDIGNERVIPFLYFVISISLFALFAWALHNRDKTLMKNKALAEAASKET